MFGQIPLLTISTDISINFFNQAYATNTRLTRKITLIRNHHLLKNPNHLLYVIFNFLLLKQTLQLQSTQQYFHTFNTTYKLQPFRIIFFLLNQSHWRPHDETHLTTFPLAILIIVVRVHFAPNNITKSWTLCFKNISTYPNFSRSKHPREYNILPHLSQTYRTHLPELLVLTPSHSIVSKLILP